MTPSFFLSFFLSFFRSFFLSFFLFILCFTLQPQLPHNLLRHRLILPGIATDPLKLDTVQAHNRHLDDDNLKPDLTLGNTLPIPVPLPLLVVIRVRHVALDDDTAAVATPAGKEGRVAVDRGRDAGAVGAAEAALDFDKIDAKHLEHAFDVSADLREGFGRRC
ncbi:hypothetical protein VTK26DRAFT_5729 [Humicola hyalothermophila]